MASLGFRHPQFSDDAEWLPAWLQPPHVAAMDSDEELRSKDSGEQSRKGTAPLEGTEGRNEDPSMLSNKGVGCFFNDLYLSDDGNSTARFSSSPSCGKMCQFDLHLSTDEISSAISNLLVDISQEERVNLNPSIQQVNSSVGRTGARQSNIDYGIEDLGLFHSTSLCGTTNNVTHPTLSNAVIAEETKVKNISKEDSHDTGMDNAVELLVAASEALVIHELLQSGSSPEISPGTAILELAFRLKQARAEVLENSCSTSESPNVDVLSDLDDSSMEEAYADVGLSVGVPCGTFVNHTAISHSKCSPVPESLPDDKTKDEGKQRTSMDFSVNIGSDNQKTQCDRPALGFFPVSGKFGDMAFPQEGDKSTGLRCQKAKSIPPALVVVTSYLSESAADAPDETSFADAHIDCSSVQKPSVGPRRHISETASASPDENSFVQACYECFKASESQPSVANSVQSGGENSCRHSHHAPRSTSESHSRSRCWIANRWPLACLDDRKDCSFSDIDPLCSIVPCSIGTQNSPLVVSKIDQAVDNREVVREDSEDEAGNLPIASVHISKTVDGEDQAYPVIGMETQPVAHRVLSSLKAFSTGFPSMKTCLKEDSPHADLVHHAESKASGLSQKNPFVLTNVSSKDAKKPQTAETTEKGEIPSAILTENACKAIIGHKQTSTGTEPGVQIHPPIRNSQCLPPVVPQRKWCLHQGPQYPVADISVKNDKEILVLGSAMKVTQRALFVNPHLQHVMDTVTPNPRKRVRFSEMDIERQRQKEVVELPVACEAGSISDKGRKRWNQKQCMGSQELKDLLRNRLTKGRKTRLIFQGLEFLLTGFCRVKQKEIEGLLRNHGAVVLSNIPSVGSRRTTVAGSNSHQLPVILSTKKLQTTRFLYGCAVNAFILNVRWVTDSIKAGSVLLPDKYMIMLNRKRYRIGNSVSKEEYVFDKVGIMLVGSGSFGSKMDILIKHGHGSVFKSLQRMHQSIEKKKISLSAIVAENQMHVSRHLRMCASELEVPIVPASWIISSLHDGKLLPIKEDASPVQVVAGKVPEISDLDDWSQEI